MLMERDVEKLGNRNLHLYAYKYVSFSDTEESDSEELMLVDDTQRESEKLGNRGIQCI